MNPSKAPSGSEIRRMLLCGILGTILLAGAVPAQAVAYTSQPTLTFTWSAASGSVDHYNVYVSVDGQAFGLLEQAYSRSCQADAEDGRTYVVQVEAEDALGHVGPMSDPSDRVVVYLDGSQNDTDGDGMTNAWEASHGLNPFDPGDADGDPDKDGLTNLQEFNAQTDPADADSDDDGIPDDQDAYPLDPLNGNSQPVADAGEDQELDPTVVTLDGTGSHDPDGDLLSYTWTQEEGPEVSLSDEHTVSPAFLAKKSGRYRFELIVHDRTVASLPDEVVVAIRNVPPAADAGEDQEVVAGTEVWMDGSRSADSNGDVMSFSWTQTDGTPVLLGGVNSQTATFVPESQGIYVFQLVTFDGHLYSSPDEVQVTVDAPDNHVPTANAGQDRTVMVGDAVRLDGSRSSDRDGDALSYAWSQIDGPESVVLKGATTVRARFDAPVAGLYEFRLIVNDGQVASAPDTVKVILETPANRVPTAVIDTMDRVGEGDWVILDGSGSHDPDRDSLTYSWSQTGGPQVMLEDGDQPVAGFYAVAEGTLTFRLVVHDGEPTSIPASAQIEVFLGDPEQVDPPDTPSRKKSDDGGGGCSVGLGGGSQREVGATDIGYVFTLFLPAIWAMLYQKRRVRRHREMQG